MVDKIMKGVRAIIQKSSQSEHPQIVSLHLIVNGSHHKLKKRSSNSGSAHQTQEALIKLRKPKFDKNEPNQPERHH